ncbi:MAG: ubiquinone/menaquinone biosynthesis methyltransferase [Candidatus Omnitrophica bacterium]|nr:ubiquinone/menaquinone biosynthesis methyltransferase [Candidatus Omnitrophota bacterium]
MAQAVFSTPHSQGIRQIFTEITPYYDFLNGLLSLRLDRAWRRWAVERAVDGSERSILDLGTGTGKFLQAFLARGTFERACGVDLCESMLERARQSVRRPGVVWLAADVSKGIPCESASVDLVSAAFTLRSLRDHLPFFFSEVFRVLKPGGKAVFLELTRPARGILKWLYYPYLSIYLPLVGALVSRSFQAYSFLANSIRHFEEPSKVAEMLKQAGFASADCSSYTGGIATLIRAKKP